MTRAAVTMIFILLAGSADAARISGVVRDRATGEPLPGANVQIAGTYTGASTEADGSFTIDGLGGGQYRLRVSYMGYRTQTRDLSLQDTSSVRLEFALESTILQTEKIIVTGSRQPEPLASAAASVGILTRAEIDRRNSTRIDEALQSVAGVTLVGENINIRGGAGYNRLGGSRSLVLIDGVPVLTSDLGAVNWNILPVSEVDHIEVLKGAASSLYGSGALSGVVNILTPLPEREPRFSFRQSSGLYDEPSVPEWKWTDERQDYHRTDLGYSQSFGPVGLRLAVTRHGSAGDRENGKFERWTYLGKMRWLLPANTVLTLFTTYSRERRGLFLQWLEQDRALNVPPTDRGIEFDLDGLLSYAVLEKSYSPDLSARIRLSYNQQLVGIPFNISNAFTPAVGLSGEIQLNWNPHRRHSISFGLDLKRDQVESLYYGGRTAFGLSPYIQEIWVLSDLLQINAGLRFDTYTLVGDSVETQLSPRIGASFQPRNGTILHFSIGRGFRAATVVERYISAGSRDFRALPNPTLEPERSTLLDLGLRQNLGETAYFETTLFHSRFSHLIEPVLSADLSAQFINTPSAAISGIETEVRWTPWRGRLSLLASATWMDPHERDSGLTLIYRPRFHAYVSASLRFGPLSFEGDYRTVSRLERVAVYPLDERVPTRVLDLRALYRWKEYTFGAHIKNALNYNYTVSERVLGEIRNFALSISGQF